MGNYVPGKSWLSGLTRPQNSSYRECFDTPVYICLNETINIHNAFYSVNLNFNIQITLLIDKLLTVHSLGSYCHYNGPDCKSAPAPAEIAGLNQRTQSIIIQRYNSARLIIKLARICNPWQNLQNERLSYTWPRLQIGASKTWSVKIRPYLFNPCSIIFFYRVTCCLVSS